MANQKVIGSFEKVSFPDLGIFDVIAKIDTGATSGSIHATHIKEIELPTGERAIRFNPLGGKSKVTVTNFSLKGVRSSNGASSLRYMIPTIIIIRGVQYPIRVSLADRTLMKKAVLVGRSFLRDHGFMIDVNIGSEYRGEVK